jgi:hypothetical protein
MLWVAISALRIPLLVSAARTDAAAVEALVRASVFEFAKTETFAFKRTASGVTLIEPSEFRVKYRVAVVAALAGDAKTAPAIRVEAIAIIDTF